MKGARAQNHCPADDKAGHHTFHSAVGDCIPEEKIQVRNIISSCQLYVLAVFHSVQHSNET
jgi:hypothetical protein